MFVEPCGPFTWDNTCPGPYNTMACSPGGLLVTMVLRLPNMPIFSRLVSERPKMSTEERVWSRLFNHRRDAITVDGLSWKWIWPQKQSALITSYLTNQYRPWVYLKTVLELLWVSALHFQSDWPNCYLTDNKYRLFSLSSLNYLSYLCPNILIRGPVFQE